ncbi:uncharacterized protein A1O5_08616 [Cladophialophora psammophila CBS 110553]|uniref:MaoC-like domain-containing protein n=1 Tax=Cladophialophora psammophila CBS 110553 TaxID=1182543 RepID=W9WTM8_9EURO|nr:uncharacterized protein A1O5_08616 [Cladophialophora psammophila CBS 110553]EXJ68001.1 hypothetical protein A1O5_08616 [Cladophialophora psammophila CBS 110553]
MLANTSIAIIAPLPILLLLFTIGVFNYKHLLPLWTYKRQIKLDFSPNELSGVDIAVVLVIFLLRSVKHSILSTYKWICNARNDVSEVPISPDEDELSLVMPFRPTQADLSAYSVAVKNSLVDRDDVQLVSSQLLLLLSALSEPAMLLLLAHRSCQIRPLGSVNVRNRFELLRPDLCTGETLVSFKEAFLTARLSKHVRTVKRGFEVDLTVSLNVLSKDSTDSIPVFRQNFTILQFARIRAEIIQGRNAAPDSTISTPAWSASIPLTVEYNDPTGWARLCKDYNPIHISTIAAKLFGFPGKLAHGNYIGALAAKYIAFANANEPLFMEITFKRPVVVPAHLELKVSPAAAEESQSRLVIITLFQIISKNKICVEGRIGQLKYTANA